MSELQGLSRKQLGEYSEQCFTLKCLLRGIVPSTPVGDSRMYDIITESEGVFKRVQIKSTTQMLPGNKYQILLAHGAKKREYGHNSFDVAALYVVPFDLFYLIPLTEITTKKIYLYPATPSKDKWRSYLERWESLKQ